MNRLLTRMYKNVQECIKMDNVNGKITKKITMKNIKVTCVRCDSKDNLEEHHIVERFHGGSDESENKEWRCEPCHKYEHTRRRLEWSLAFETQRGQADRIRCYQHRLDVLDSLNTPELIRGRGIYLSYWTDRTTRYLPRRIRTKEEVKFDKRFKSLQPKLKRLKHMEVL